MIDLSTKYLGLSLKNPIVISACSMTRDLEKAKELEEMGAAAIVMPSLFEEEISYDQNALDHFFQSTEYFNPEGVDYFPEVKEYQNMHGEDYLEDIAQLKKHLKIPVIASLNGVSSGGWIKYAQKIEKAGADAIELNIYVIPTDLNLSASSVEAQYIDIATQVKKSVSIPVAVKLHPFFSNVGNIASQLVNAGVDGLVMFNRFLEPDFDLEEMSVNTKMDFSRSYEMRLPLHWTAILSGNLETSLAANRGVKNPEDAIKLLMAGADVVMIAGVLYQEGTSAVKRILDEMKTWMTIKEYESVSQLKGSMSYKKVEDPKAFERANYVKILKSID